ncbi:DUF6241 domain-containing protein [Paenisporosarcina sp. TG20]|uniref:DUF6241 domain-containing protein n=1 Tax=Paenisporosarcina sp. TG20 TaxID=1211706 RepID=UPI00031CAA90|nr:DUF6241 domain-containing protein [Paenisporosarcina sp. TG20]
MNKNNNKTFKLNKVQKLVIGLGVVGLIGTLIYIKIKPELPMFTKTDVTVNKTIDEDGATVIELVDEDDFDLEIHMPMDLTDDKIGVFIHRMAHQKVIADEKWGNEPLTMNRVVRLIDVIEENKSNYKHSGTYLRILEKWRNNDFTEVDFDHNEIWRIQSGTVGRATGILSYEEEQSYIERHYNTD